MIEEQNVIGYAFFIVIVLLGIIFNIHAEKYCLEFEKPPVKFFYTLMFGLAFFMALCLWA